MNGGEWGIWEIFGTGYFASTCGVGVPSVPATVWTRPSTPPPRCQPPRPEKIKKSYPQFIQNVTVPLDLLSDSARILA